MIRDFHDHPAYIGALAANVRRHWEAHGRGAMLVMSFHGLPQRGGAGSTRRSADTTGMLLADELRLNERNGRVTFPVALRLRGMAAALHAGRRWSGSRKAQDEREVDVALSRLRLRLPETLEEIGIAARAALPRRRRHASSTSSPA